MTKGVLRWGLLSTARINRRLIPALRASTRAELVAVASRDQARAEAYAAEWEIPVAYGSYEALLAAPGVDVIYISLPNSLHAHWTIRAAGMGKHVLCEKPLALTIEQVDAIHATARAARVVVAEAIMYLYHPLLKRMSELVQEGAIGELRLARGSFSFFLDRPDDVRWQADLGGGALWDVGIYPVSLIRWLLGEPTTLFGWQTLTAGDVDHTFAGLLRYPDGPMGLFDCGFAAPLRVEAEVVGAEGVLRLERPFVLNLDGHESQLQLIQAGSATSIDMPGDRVDPYLCEVEAIADAVLDGAPLPVPLDSSRANVATLLALYESARTGRPVAMTGS